MAAKWKIEGNDQKFLVEELEKRRNANSGPGSVTFTADLDFEYMVTLLQSAIELSSEISEFDSREIFHDGLGDAGASGKLTPSSLIGAVGKREHKFLSQQEHNFMLVSSLLVRHSQVLSGEAYGQKTPEGGEIPEDKDPGPTRLRRPAGHLQAEDRRTLPLRVS